MEDKKRQMISIYIFGKRYEVPEGLTIQRAMEYSGYQFIRNCGCRGGICGACLTEYRIPNNYKLKIVLACQSIVEPEIQITQSPFIPMNRVQYELEKLKVQNDILGRIYPEIFRCLQCNTCVRVCPMEINVMEYIAYAIRGEIEKVATLSFPCVMCGACASKCPAEISQPNVALLARRIYGRYIKLFPQHLYQRIEEIKNEKYKWVLETLTRLPTSKLIDLYTHREQEPQDHCDWNPRERDFVEHFLRKDEA